MKVPASRAKSLWYIRPEPYPLGLGFTDGPSVRRFIMKSMPFPIPVIAGAAPAIIGNLACWPEPNIVQARALQNQFDLKLDVMKVAGSACALGTKQKETAPTQARACTVWWIRMLPMNNFRPSKEHGNKMERQFSRSFTTTQ